MHQRRGGGHLQKYGADVAKPRQVIDNTFANVTALLFIKNVLLYLYQFTTVVLIVSDQFSLEIPVLWRVTSDVTSCFRFLGCLHAVTVTIVFEVKVLFIPHHPFRQPPASKGIDRKILLHYILITCQSSIISRTSRDRYADTSLLQFSRGTGGVWLAEIIRVGEFKLLDWDRPAGAMSIRWWPTSKKEWKTIIQKRRALAKAALLFDLIFYFKNEAKIRSRNFWRVFRVWPLWSSRPQSFVASSWMIIDRYWTV